MGTQGTNQIGLDEANGSLRVNASPLRAWLGRCFGLLDLVKVLPGPCEFPEDVMVFRINSFQTQSTWIIISCQRQDR